MKALKGDEAFDLVILDYNLGRGKKNGLQLLEDIRKNQSGTSPIVFLSGEGTIEIAVKSHENWVPSISLKKTTWTFRWIWLSTKVTKLLATLQEKQRAQRRECQAQVSKTDVYKQELYRKYQIVGISESHEEALRSRRTCCAHP